MTEEWIHPLALVETKVIGPGTRIWAFTHVMNGVAIGANCNIGDHCFLEKGVCVGNNVTIKNGNMIWDGVLLEDGVFIGPQVVFTNDRYPRSPRLPQAKRRYSDSKWLLPTLVRRGASVGAGAVLLAGITVGPFAMVSAGAVITRDVPPYALAVGVPARLRGWVCQCGQSLQFQQLRATCSECGSAYSKIEESTISAVADTTWAAHP
jgi:acetyltransferase-like isoleucine patch superfamily enzyme